MAENRIVEVGDATLDALASRAEVVQALPHVFAPLLAASSAASRACGRCGKAAAARAALRAQYEAAKHAIATASPDQLALLKGFLAADVIRVVSGKDRRNIPIRHTR